MKKTSMLLVGAAMLAAMVLSGCKDLTSGAKVDTDSSKWTGQKKDENGNAKTVVLEGYDETENDWWCWTTEEGYVLEIQPAFDKSTKTFDFTSIVTTADTEYVLYISDKERTPKNKNLNKGEADYRGRVKVYKDFATKIVRASAPEEVLPMGLLKLTNDEPVNTSLFPDGCYTITELWPLTPKNNAANKVGTKFEVDAAMKWQKLKIEKNDSKTFLIPAGECIIGIYQPYRGYTDETKNKDKTSTMLSDRTAEKICARWGKFETQTDGSEKWVIDPENGDKSMAMVYGVSDKYYNNFAPVLGKEEKIIEEYRDANLSAMFGKKFKLTAHTSTAVSATSNGFTDYTFKYNTAFDNITRIRSAEEEAVEVDVIPGSFEK